MNEMNNETCGSSSCYTEELIETGKNGFLEESCAMTYIIHLVGNGRYETLIKEYHEFPTTENAILVRNQGYKRGHICQKHPKIQTSFQDLTDAFFTVMRMAERDYPGQNILILEDDFVMVPEPYESISVKKEVNEFILQHQHENMVYSLGLVPFVSSVSLLYDEPHRISYMKITTHAILYTSSFRKYILSKYSSFSKEESAYRWLELPLLYQDWDMLLEKERQITKYFYYQPICIQKLTMTENSKSHQKKFDHAFLQFLTQIYSQYVLNMHKDIETKKELVDRWNRLYQKSHWINWILRIFILAIFLLLLFLLFFLFQRYLFQNQHILKQPRIEKK